MTGPMAKKQKADVDNDPQFQTTRSGANSVLRANLERIHRLEEEKKGIADDVKDIYNELKASGYDGPTCRRMSRLLKMENAKRDEMDALDATYRDELGIPSQH
jgi:uncharacterized protein (UPF0335 family)